MKFFSKHPRPPSNFVYHESKHHLTFWAILLLTITVVLMGAWGLDMSHKLEYNKSLLLDHEIIMRWGRENNGP